MNYVHLSILRKIIPFLLFQCIEKMSHANCPVCQEYLHTSPNPCHIPPCHHLVHKHCFEGLLSNGHYYCPTCSKSLLDLSPLWQIMQNQIEKSPMQGRYKVSSMTTTNRKYQKVPAAQALSSPSGGAKSRKNSGGDSKNFQMHIFHSQHMSRNFYQ